MAPSYYQLGFTAVVFITLAVATLQFSSCLVLKGSVTCLDCNHQSDLSGIKVSVKCSQVKTLAMATTEEDGSFVSNLPFDTSPTSTAANICYAKILGGPKQLFVSKKDTEPTVVKSQEDDDNSYTISKPLNFYTRYSKFGSSKTIDLPVPKEWGLAPTSYYIPFIPIIGIP